MIKTKLISLIIMITIVFSLVGCSKDAVGITYEIDMLPINIDPQSAQNSTELLIVGNIFEGLVRVDANGDLVPAAAERYEISADGKTYTFYLKNNLFWQDETPLTADDFVFAFRRGADKSTNSPHKNLMLPISGVASSLAGSASSDTIGVSALQPHILQIQLDKPNDRFLASLCDAVFMPCNKAFFEKSGGKYGLKLKTILGNGSYKLTRWEENKTIRLSKSHEYKGSFIGSLDYAVLSFPTKKDNEKSSKTKRLASGDITMAQIDFWEKENLINAKVEISDCENSAYAFVYNQTSPPGSSPDILSAFTLSIDRENLKKTLSPYLKCTDTLIPPCLKVDGKVITEFDNLFGKDYLYAPDNSRDLFLKAIKKLPQKTLGSFNILCEDNKHINPVLKEIISYWQKSLGIVVNIESVSSVDELKKRVHSGDFTAAFVPFSSPDDTVQTFLESFSEGGRNYFGQQIPEYNQLMLQASDTTDMQKKIQLLSAAEKELLDSNLIIPILNSSVSFAYSSEFENVNFSPTGSSIDFSYITVKR